MALLTVFLFVIGACFGSFIDVVIDRLPGNKNIFLSRSVCEKCLKKISAYDLIPIVSFIVLRGKCRNCKAKIPVRIFLVELLTASLFVLLFLFSFVSWGQYTIYCAVALVLIAITLIDLEHGVIPDKLLLIFGIVSLLFILLTNPATLVQHLLTGIVSLLFFLLIFLITRGRGIGFGDVKYAFFIGFFLSVSQAIIAFYTAFLTGALISIILIMVGKKRIKGTIAFGPFLSLGVLVAMLFEKQILAVVLPLLNL